MIDEQEFHDGAPRPDDFFALRFDDHSVRRRRGTWGMSIPFRAAASMMVHLGSTSNSLPSIVIFIIKNVQCAAVLRCCRSLSNVDQFVSLSVIQFIC
jgi:hypothetical protein